METILHLKENDDVQVNVSRISDETVYLSVKRQHGEPDYIEEEFTIFGSLLQIRYIVDQLAQKVEEVPESFTPSVDETLSVPEPFTPEAL